jgi:small subunit ribosomal protein S2
MENTETTNTEVTTDQPVEINLKSLLQVGAHFGTRTALWNPKCAGFIYGVRNGVYIINLEDTVKFWKTARELITSTVANGGTVLFVGTKKQASDAVFKHAQRCGAFYVNHKWSAGTLTNFKVLRRSVEKMENFERIVKEATDTGKSPYTKKELGLYQRTIDKMLKSFGGIRAMRKPPTLVFITDSTREALAVSEANKLDIPVISLADTDCDPATINYPIPANDDAVRALDLFCAAVADAVIAGKEQYKLNKVSAEKLVAESTEPLTEELVEKLNQEPQEKRGDKRPHHNKKPRRDKNLQVETKKV